MRQYLLSTLSYIAIFFILLSILLMSSCSIMEKKETVEIYEITNEQILKNVTTVKRMCEAKLISLDNCESIKTAYIRYQRYDSAVNDAWVAVIENNMSENSQHLITLQEKRKESLLILMNLLSAVLTEDK